MEPVMEDMLTCILKIVIWFLLTVRSVPQSKNRNYKITEEYECSFSY